MAATDRKGVPPELSRVGPKRRSLPFKVLDETLWTPFLSIVRRLCKSGIGDKGIGTAATQICLLDKTSRLRLYPKRAIYPSRFQNYSVWTYHTRVDIRGSIDVLPSLKQIAEDFNPLWIWRAEKPVH